MSQTTVTAGGQAIGDPGQIDDGGLVTDVVSGFNENAVQMPWGYGLRQGTTADFYALASGFSGVLPCVGVNAYSSSHQPAITLGNGQVIGDLGASGLNQNASLRVMRKGRVIVPVEGTVTLGHGAWCRGGATGSLTQGSWLGAARGGAGPLGASYHVDCSKQARFVSGTSTASDGTTSVAILEVDFTNSAY